MKQINVTVEDDEFDRLDEAKGDRTWRETLLEDICDD